MTQPTVTWDEPTQYGAAVITQTGVRYVRFQDALGARNPIFPTAIAELDRPWVNIYGNKANWKMITNGGRDYTILLNPGLTSEQTAEFAH